MNMSRESVQQAVWTTIRAMNDAWTQGSPDALVEYFHPRMTAITGSERLRRVGAAACIEGWRNFAQAFAILYWRELEPAIEVFGDAAVVSYYYEIGFERDGRRFDTAGRDMFFLVCDRGRWWIVGDHFSSYPA